MIAFAPRMRSRFVVPRSSVGSRRVMQRLERRRRAIAPDEARGASDRARRCVRVRAAGVNPVDAYIHTGTYARKPPLPYTPGVDGAGEVEAVGADVAGFKPGDRVYIAGPAMRPAAPAPTPSTRSAAARSCIVLPARVSFAQGAAIGVPYATAYRALFQRATARPGETVLVHGATGGVGIAAVQLAHAHGLRVIGSGGTERGLAAVREHGADVVVNHRDAELHRRDHARDRRPRRRRDRRDGRAHQPRSGSRPARASTAASSWSATADASRSTRARRWAATPRSSA